MNNNDHYLIQTFTKLPDHRRCHSSLLYDHPPRRNSYKMAIYTSKHDHLQFQYSSSSSMSSINKHINTTRSLYTIHNGCSHCINDHIQRSISQPVVHSPNSDFLLENATFLLDSPVHALLPARHKSRGTLSSIKPLSNRTITTNELLNETYDYPNPSMTSVAAIYRIVFFRSFASVFALASLFTIEVLQTSIYSNEHSFQSLLTFHLSSSLTALIFAAHISHIQTAHYRWQVSNVLAYDRCSQISIICTTLLTSSWIIMQYFHSFYYLLMLSTIISGISLSYMIIKTFDHFLQLSTSLLMENMKILTIRFNIFMFIHNCLCHLALSIGGVCLLIVIIFKQWKHEYKLMGFPSCRLIPCLQIIQQQDAIEKFFKPLSPSMSINLTSYVKENKREWINESTRYIFLGSLILLTIISLCIQVNTEWSTSMMSTSKRLSMLYHSNGNTSNSISKLLRYKNYLIAIFIGFQEGYLFGSLIKYDVTCVYGLRHTAEMLIIYGLGATISSILIALIIKRLTIMISVSFTTFLHATTMILLFSIRAQNVIYNLQPLMLRYILFSCYGIVLGLWSTIAIHSLCHSAKFSSSSLFAQSLAFRYFGRMIAYLCTLHLCQAYLFYINTLSLLCVFSIIFICYCRCHQ